MATNGDHSPLTQFEIKPIIGDWVVNEDGTKYLPFFTFTNSSLFMLVAIAGVLIFLSFGMRRGAMVPGRWQSMSELSYEFVANLIKDTIGSEGRKYFPIVFTLFMFVLFANLLGMLPYSFTVTSHIIVTFTLAIVVFIGVTILAVAKHGLHFFSYFVPPGSPVAMWPLLIPIEVISYLSRPISLSVRLFANMLAGHTLLKVIAGFIAPLGVFGVLPFALITALTGLEILIAFLQAYVFAILTCLYINDALHLH